MALRNLTKWNDPLFRKQSRPVETFDARLWVLLDDMLETLVSVSGYGCAAVHVGSLRRAIVINDGGGLIELINPVITWQSDETQDVPEGSIAPGAPRGVVVRPKEVAVAGFDRNGNPQTLRGSGFLAATFCHEIDHLSGILFTDKIRKQA